MKRLLEPSKMGNYEKQFLNDGSLSCSDCTNDSFYETFYET